MRGWRTLSLQARQLAAASLALVAFLGFTGYALDRAFVETAQNALRERLADLANGYLSGSELDRGRAFISPETPPDLRFMIPGSGLYASVRGEGLRWESASSLGRSLPPVAFGTSALALSSCSTWRERSETVPTTSTRLPMCC